MIEEKAVLALADGTIFRGKSIGASGRVNGEIVFNTSMTGYQEILTDPSYSKQIVTLTYPHIGNTGTNQEDIESGNIWCSGLVIRSNSLLASNWRSENSLTEYLKTNNIFRSLYLSMPCTGSILRVDYLGKERWYKDCRGAIRESRF